jgi:choline-sulfatase
MWVTRLSRTRDRWGTRSTSWGRWLVGVLIALTAASGAWGAQRRDAPPPVDNILLITVDTLRADHLGAYGHPEADTPVFDALARQGTLFRTAYTTCNVTGPSHASIMTGLYPQRHGMLGNAWRLDASLEKLATVLSRAGFRTGAFVSTAVLSSAAGLDDGFEEYDQAFLRNVEFERTLQRRGDQTVDAALSWLSKPDRRRFFVWVHLFDPHAPYDPPASVWPAVKSRLSTDSATLTRIYQGRAKADPATVQRIRELYHAEVRFVDRQLDRLMGFLAREELLGNTLIAITADHGEELADHMRFFEHNRSLYEGVIRVPLIVVDPATRGTDLAGREVATPVQILDLMPTILERAGVPVPAGIDARSLTRLMRAEEAADARGFALVQRPHNPQFFPRGDAFAWVRGGEKVIVFARGPAEHYNLTSDPGERRDLNAKAPLASQRLRRELADQLRALRAQADRLRQHRVDLREQRERLRALGYVVDGPADEPSPAADTKRGPP